MKTLIIGNFRTGSYYLHDKIVRETGCSTMHEIFRGSSFDDIKEKLNVYNTTENVIAKLHPVQAYGKGNNYLDGGHLSDALILKYSYYLCEIADKIIYIQRQDTLEQVVSWCVARQQWSEGDQSPWLSERMNYSKQITNEQLDNSYKKMAKNQELIAEIYKKYPAEVITLEKDLEHRPYLNKYNYEGDWNIPQTFKMLGENI